MNSDEHNRLLSFLSLPDDIQREILDISNVYSVTKEYFESMRYYRERKCMKSISTKEIVKAIGKGCQIIINNTEDLFLSSIISRKSYYISIGGSFITIYKALEEDIVVEYNDSFITSKMVISGHEINLNNVTVSYDNVYLISDTIREIFKERGEICHKYTKSFIRDHIMTLKESLNKYTFVGYLLLCLDNINMNLFDITNKYSVFHTVRISRVRLEDVDALYEELIEIVLSNI